MFLAGCRESIARAGCAGAPARMGKNKPWKKPPGAKPSGGKSSSPGLIVALVVAGVAVAAGVWLLRPGPSAPQAPSRNSRKSAEERLLEGRISKDAKKQRPQCVDAPGADCAARASKDACEHDSPFWRECCRSCYNTACEDTDPSCESWAQAGQCYLNKEYMVSACCKSCSIDPDDACSHDPTSRPDVAEGDIEKIFERAVADYPQYSPTVHSRDPWVVTFDDLLTPDECDGIIEAVGGKNGEYIKPSTTAKQSRDKNGRLMITDVPDQIRTSHNAWCQHAGCYRHPTHIEVIKRIMGIVGLPHNNAEHMQLLKYGPGEYYRLHHDWIPEQVHAGRTPACRMAWPRNGAARRARGSRVLSALGALCGRRRRSVGRACSRSFST